MIIYECKHALVAMLAGRCYSGWNIKHTYIASVLGLRNHSIHFATCSSSHADVYSYAHSRVVSLPQKKLSRRFLTWIMWIWQS